MPFNVLLQGQSYLWCWNNNQHYYWEVCFKFPPYSTLFCFNVASLFKALLLLPKLKCSVTYSFFQEYVILLICLQWCFIHFRLDDLCPPGSMDDHILLMTTSSSLGCVVVLPLAHWRVLFSISCVLDIVKQILKYRENIFLKNNF